MSAVLDRDRSRAATSIVREKSDVALAAVQEAAAKHRMWVHLGSLAVRNDRKGPPYVNRSFVIDGAGAIRARYDKLHLFDVDLPTGESWRESSAFAAGECPVVVESPWGRIGLSICYDIRFPELYRSLVDAGATILSIPAAFTVPTGRAHWEMLVRARAIESGAFVIAAAQCGRHLDGRETYGHSLVVDPWGEVLLDMADKPGVQTADLELDRVRGSRPSRIAARLRPPR
jgi:deaminated glutathione amidase